MLVKPLVRPIVRAIAGNPTASLGSGFSPTSLFADGAKGVFYDNNDFVDSATWRRNLLLYSEQFDNPSWQKAASGTGVAPTVTPNATTAPDGTLTADAVRFQRASNSSGNLSYLQSNAASVTAINYAGTFWIKASRPEDVGKQIQFRHVSAGPVLSITLTAEWRREGRVELAIAGSRFMQIGFVTTGGDVDVECFIWGAQLEVGSAATDYQRITDFNSDFLAAFPSTTLFLDSAGTTPATVNGLVGLQLDKSAGLALGAETVVNGGFDSDTTWTKGTGWAIGSGVATHTGATPGYISQPGLTVGKTYRITLTITNSDGRSLQLIGAFWTSNLTVGSSPGTYTVHAIASSDTMWFYANTIGTTISVDNISVKELPGNHRYQATTGSKPILRGTPTGANLVTNGDFATDTVWTKGIGWTIGSGVATKTAGAAQSIFQAITPTVGNIYRITYTITVTAGVFQPFLGGGTSVFGALRTASGTYVEYLTAAAGNNSVGITTNTTSAGTVDNVEVVDVSAGSVTAPYGLQYDGVDDFLQTAAVDFATATSDGLARRNLLTFPSAFDNAAWTSAAVGSVAVANQVAAPDGTLTADLLREDTSTGNHYNSQSPTVTNTAHTFSVYYKIASGTRKLALYNANTNVGRQFDATGVISAGVFNTPAGGFGVEAIGNGWYRAWITTTPAAGSGAWRLWLVTSADALSYTGDGASGFYVWGAQLEAGSTASAFQNIGTDKMFVCAGVRKLSDAAVGALVELSSNVTTNAGAFAVFAPLSTGLQNFNFQSAGSALSSVSRNDRPAPTLRVLTCIGNISGDIASLTVSGDATVTSTTDQGTGNYGNYPLYFGRRGGASLPYNGLDFGFVICGKTLTSTQIANTERWMSYRTGVTL